MIVQKERAVAELQEALSQINSGSGSEEAERTNGTDDSSHFLAFHAIKGQSFSVVDGKFTYTLQVGHAVTQSAEGEGTVTLGTFDGFERDTKDHSGNILLKFRDGDYCYAFGPRSAHVEAECGPDNRLLDAMEPSTCFYALRFETPAACNVEFAESNGILAHI